jgi:hypothetical protein
MEVEDIQLQLSNLKQNSGIIENEKMKSSMGESPLLK